MRQYQIYYKRGAGGTYAILNPNDHRPLYNRPTVVKAVAFLRDNPDFDGVAFRIEDDRYNIMVPDQQAIAPNAFLFDGGE
jgi:hypothetical protein